MSEGGTMTPYEKGRHDAILRVPRSAEPFTPEERTEYERGYADGRRMTVGYVRAAR